jgi:hypothetical protein
MLYSSDFQLLSPLLLTVQKAISSIYDDMQVI